MIDLTMPPPRENFRLIHRDDLRRFRQVHFLYTLVFAVLVIITVCGIVLAWHGVTKLQDGAAYSREASARARENNREDTK